MSGDPKVIEITRNSFNGPGCFCCSHFIVCSQRQQLTEVMDRERFLTVDDSTDVLAVLGDRCKQWAPDEKHEKVGG